MLREFEPLKKRVRCRVGPSLLFYLCICELSNPAEGK